MSELTREDALSILKSRTIVNGIGKYQVKVTSVHPHEDKNIVNVNAMNFHQANEAKANLVAGEIQKSVNSNLSLSILGDRPCPSKGEFINIQVGKVALKDKETKELTGETALLIVGWSEIAVSEGLSSFDFEAEFTKEEAKTNAEFQTEA